METGKRGVNLLDREIENMDGGARGLCGGELLLRARENYALGT